MVDEFHRVLRPGATAIVMVYHRSSFNHHVSIIALRRALVAMLLVPACVRMISSTTGEGEEVLRGHRELLREHGLRYLRDKQLFLSNNTDGPGNPLSKVYSRGDAVELFARFEEVRTDVRFLHLQSYPAGRRRSGTRFAARLGQSWGLHLWVQARR